MSDISWGLVAAFAACGLPMALLSCLVGMRPKVETPLWWGVYLVWAAIAFFGEIEAVFSTLFVGSILAGFVHATTTALLLDRYVANNPWHAEKMQGPKWKLRAQFMIMGVVIGSVFGAAVAGLAWWVAS